MVYVIVFILFSAKLIEKDFKYKISWVIYLILLSHKKNITLRQWYKIKILIFAI